MQHNLLNVGCLKSAQNNRYPSFKMRKVIYLFTYLRIAVPSPDPGRVPSCCSGIVYACGSVVLPTSLFDRGRRSATVGVQDCCQSPLSYERRETSPYYTITDENHRHRLVHVVYTAGQKQPASFLYKPFRVLRVISYGQNSVPHNYRTISCFI